jgi:hypothetical protein
VAVIASEVLAEVKVRRYGYLHFRIMRDLYRNAVPEFHLLTGVSLR